MRTSFFSSFNELTMLIANRVRVVATALCLKYIRIWCYPESFLLFSSVFSYIHPFFFCFCALGVLIYVTPEDEWSWDGEEGEGCKVSSRWCYSSEAALGILLLHRSVHHWLVGCQTSLSSSAIPSSVFLMGIPLCFLFTFSCFFLFSLLLSHFSFSVLPWHTELLAVLLIGLRNPNLNNY